MSTERSLCKTAVYGLWSYQFGFLLFAETYQLFVDSLSFRLLFLLLPFMFELFLLFTTASRIPILAPWTKRFHRFFYETRDWAMVLPVLSILWVFGILMVAGLVFTDLIGSGPINRTLGFIQPYLGFVVYIIYIGGVVTFIPLPFWTAFVGFQACMRVKNLRSPEEEEAMGLTAKDDDDEWNGFQDNRGD
ncbi:uncharacterized protein FSUBG_4157 [Fusarium subglutinans]|uniref:Uncharacterized protein n=1 Tax=Gibberella subglutinans TaxID=42677 RepID=A0A8H5Q5Q7_GIBSU|nr:uncharacterized protein FSUBG_4157 [Fusarium subglutinans]KAF5609147.1 hypothetical protein FSUBG_4157 [Fusarium subglutinans]